MRPRPEKATGKEVGFGDEVPECRSAGVPECLWTSRMRRACGPESVRGGESESEGGGFECLSAGVSMEKQCEAGERGSGERQRCFDRLSTTNQWSRGGSAEAFVIFLVGSDPMPEKHLANEMSDGTVGNDRDRCATSKSAARLVRLGSDRLRVTTGATNGGRPGARDGMGIQWCGLAGNPSPLL